MKNKVYIGVPTSDSIHSEMVAFIVKMKERQIKQDDVRIIVSKGKPQNPNVNIMINDFLNNYKDCSHMLILNSDVVPPLDIVDRLLALDKPVVGNAVAIWREDNGLMICAFNGEHGKQTDIDFAKEPLGKCEWVGGACLMVKRKVFEDFLQTFGHPIFGVEYNEKTGAQELGSDERFCRYCWTLGHEVWYDARIIIPQHIHVLLRGSFDDGKLKQEVVDNHLYGRKVTYSETHGEK